MKKLWLFTVLVGLFTNFTCESEYPECKGNYPCCMQDDIELYRKDYQAHESWMAYIVKYDYEGQPIYMFDPGPQYADWLIEYVDEDCNVLCERGGIAGIDTCSDYELTPIDTIYISGNPH